MSHINTTVTWNFRQCHASIQHYSETSDNVLWYNIFTIIGIIGEVGCVGIVGILGISDSLGM